MKTYEEYKVSGVKWLGKVPKHWEICRFKDFISLQTQTSLSENKIGLENIECATGKFIETNSEFEGNGIAFDVGDVIYGKLRPYLKKVWLYLLLMAMLLEIFLYLEQRIQTLLLI